LNLAFQSIEQQPILKIINHITVAELSGTEGGQQKISISKYIS
jgi:hypothetical protein